MCHVAIYMVGGHISLRNKLRHYWIISWYITFCLHQNNCVKWQKVFTYKTNGPSLVSLRDHALPVKWLWRTLFLSCHFYVMTKATVAIHHERVPGQSHCLTRNPPNAMKPLMFVFSSIQNLHLEGILPKGPYLPCVSMAGRAFSAGYHRLMYSM